MSTKSRDFSRELEMLVDRLRSMSLVRLAAPLPPNGSRADAVRALLDEFSLVTSSLEDVPVRRVPVLGDESVGDQLAVLGNDFLGACRDDALLDEFAAKLKALRVSL